MEFRIILTFGAENPDAFERWLVSLSGGADGIHGDTPEQFDIDWFRVERVDSVLDLAESNEL